jgi:glycosyltransferase involved in cell wall biosynthesis/predicted deacetylase
MKLALLTAAIDGDNSGDALIESAIVRLLKDAEYDRLPLKGPFANEEIARINACDAAVICGTNLYQETFACGLTPTVVRAIEVPIIPFGIGSSAPMGRIPHMNAAGVEAVRAIHGKCRVGSVRDNATLRFLRSIGIENVELTGCPVLFHGLSCPDFRPSGQGYTLTPRARLLHIDEQWQKRQLQTLDYLARRYLPQLVLQSPYDLEIAERLAAKFGLKIILDDGWQAEPYVKVAQEQSVSLGFRLHFAMLSIAYGKPAFLVSHDSRADEFCKLLDLPSFRIDNYSDSFLSLKIDSRDFPSDTVRRRWTKLGAKLNSFIRANGLASNLEIDETPQRGYRHGKLQRKPRICILADVPGWAYDNSMQQIRKQLSGEFDMSVRYVSQKPQLYPSEYDLLHVCFCGEEYYKQFGFDPERTIKEISSHRWQHDAPYGPITAEQFAERYLADCATAICTSVRLLELMPLAGVHIRHTPNGVDVEQFCNRDPRDGPLIFGWAGNAGDPLKRFSEIVEPACKGRSLCVAKGEYGHKGMPLFYNGIDVFLVASQHEGEPLTLIEAMACGCFPVCTDVGIVPELVEHQVNGYVVRDATVAGFREAFLWCEQHADMVRAAGRANAEMIARERNWPVCAQFFARAYKETLLRVKPKFRNDDVSWDTSLPNLKRFSEVFYQHGQSQIHGVCLNGCTNAAYRLGDVAVEYDGFDTISRLSNVEIRRLSSGKSIRARGDLVKWLNTCADELALHGLYHTDYSTMSREEQEQDIADGLELMRELFPRKKVRFFFAPFNRTSNETFIAAERHGLRVVAADGVHLEEKLENLDAIEPGQWYRYHHHRFYPESRFDFHKLSIEKLEGALKRCFSTQPQYLGLTDAGHKAPFYDWRRVEEKLMRVPLLRRVKKVGAVVLNAGGKRFRAARKWL